MLLPTRLVYKLAPAAETGFDVAAVSHIETAELSLPEIVRWVIPSADHLGLKFGHYLLCAPWRVSFGREGQP
jgi:hypothetical protein